MVIDVVSYNGEKELFEIRYNILRDFVDEFRVIEFDHTFSGKPKEQLFNQEYDKVKHFFVPQETWSKYRELAISSPNTEYGKGANHWITEFAQKESVKECLEDLHDEDTLFIGDCDEVWNPKLAEYDPRKTHKLELLVYSYYLNNRSSEQFYGTIFTKYGFIRYKCLNHVRSLPSYYEYRGNGGWHFTSMGGYEKVKNKLEDSYTSDSYANLVIMENLYNNMGENRDFLGRNFIYKIDESQWPQYLKDNRDRYKYLLKS